ncbi:MAG: molybdopterin cofactor-binding domain-containing protein, partial [Candidatus Binataceae bacterium]
MKPIEDRANAIENVSRRGFLKGVLSTGALVLSVHLLPRGASAAAVPISTGTTRADRATLHPSAFVGVDSDGTVYIVAHRSEMGTGIRTSLPLVVADELDADWKRVRIEQAIGDWRYGG